MSGDVPGPSGGEDGSLQLPRARGNPGRAGYLAGAPIGAALAVLGPVVGFAVGSLLPFDPGTHGGEAITFGLVGGVVLPYLIGLMLLPRSPSRAWGVGILIGAAVTQIVLGGACAGFLWLLVSG